MPQPSYALHPPSPQILGAEARARVPYEFMAQHRHHANPPTLLLRISRLLDTIEGGKLPQPAREARLGVMRRAWPRLLRWYDWLCTTQAGAVPGTFRWRGRDPQDTRLNALTLSSGLDDFPRASVPNERERHVDLLCWVAFASRVLGRLANQLGMEGEGERLLNEHALQMKGLDKYHWNEEAGAYCDYGYHSNEGEFKLHYVVKCGSADNTESVMHAIPNPRRPSCPRTHPRFLFPLGDGSGGLLTREVFSSRKLRLQWVEHLGYVALFPLLLRLLPPSSPRLPRLLELLRDPQRLWSPYGIRSLSLADLWHARENAPGDQPYWRGPIWININYLALGGLHYYAQQQGPSRARAAVIYTELRDNLVSSPVDGALLYALHSPPTFPLGTPPMPLGRSLHIPLSITPLAFLSPPLTPF